MEGNQERAVKNGNLLEKSEGLASLPLAGSEQLFQQSILTD